MSSRTLLRMAELDLEYGIKEDFFRALCDCFGPIVHRGLGERLYKREEIEAALDRHALEGHPSVAEMQRSHRAAMKSSKGEKATA